MGSIMAKFLIHLNTKIYFGIGEISKLGSVCKAYKKVMIVIGSGSVEKAGILEKAQNSLDAKNIKHFLFKGIEPNPRNTTIDKAGEFAHQNNIEAIIALGGGSVMDASKLIAVVAKQGGKSWDYLRRDKKQVKIKEAIDIITIPTLSATGSETNVGAVITNTKTEEKYAIHSKIMLPITSIIDPELTISAPVKYVVDGAIDIIVHVLETYLSSKTETPIADNLSLAFAKTAKDTLETILRTQKEIRNNEESLKTNLKARESMAWTASLAINGILSIQNGGWPLHTIEHIISAIYDISHGAGLSFLLVPFLEFNKDLNKDKISKFLGYFLKGNLNFYNNNIDKGIQDFLDWQKTVGAGESSKIRPSDMDINKIVANTFEKDKNGLFNVREITKADLEEILKRMQELYK